MTDIGVYDIHICPMVFVFEIQVQAPLVVRMFSFIIVLFCKTQVVDCGCRLGEIGMDTLCTGSMAVEIINLPCGDTKQKTKLRCLSGQDPMSTMQKSG